MFAASATLDALLRGGLLVAISVLWVILLVRIVGLRSFSKMTSFDFVATVAAGSMLAGAAQATSWSAFLQANAALAGLFAVQYVLAWLRKRSDAFENLIQNRPVLLMYDGHILDTALRDTRVARDDLLAKLREANVLKLSEVRAAVLETTGDLSVIHGDDFDPTLINGVRGGPGVS